MLLIRDAQAKAMAEGRTMLITPCPRRTWIEVALVGMTGKPIPRERYVVVTADGRRIEGRLDDAGLATVQDIHEGDCRVIFPDLDEHAVDRA
ncbi:MAG: hypothetical protein QM742_03985 [Aquabacterium sp.]